MRALVDTARRGRVRRFVYLSVSPNLPDTTPLVRYKRETEAAVRGSGMGWVVIQPSAFIETCLDRRAGFDVAGGRVGFLGSGDAPVSYVSVRDVAKVAAAMASPLSDVSRTNIPVGGPVALSAREVVRIFEEESGHSFAVVHAPTPVARGAGFLLRPFHAELSSALGIAAHRAAQGDVIERSPLVQDLVGRPVTVRDFARYTARAALAARIRILLGGASRI